MKSSDKKDERGVLTPKEGDDVCWNCVGVYFLSNELVKEGKKPICFGYEYKTETKVSPDEMRALEQLPIVPPTTKIYALGHVQSTGRMQRLGQFPVLKSGIQLQQQNLSTKESRGDEPTSRNLKDTLKPPVGNRSDADQDAKHAAHQTRQTHPAIQTTPSNTMQTRQESELSRFISIIQRCSTKLSMDSGKIIEQFPTRFAKNADRLSTAVHLRLEREMARFWPWKGSNDSGKHPK